MLKNTYVGWNHLTLITFTPTTIMFMMFLAIILREERILMIYMIVPIILYMLPSLHNCTNLIVMWSNLLPLLVTIMKEEVIDALFMLLIICCIHLLIICICLLPFAVTHSYTRCQCIGRKLGFVATVSISCVASCHALTWPLSWLAWAHLGTPVFSCHFSPQ